MGNPVHAAVRRDYARLAADYEDRWHAFNSSTREWVLTHWPDHLRDDARVLDVGCGSGGWLARLSRQAPGLRLTGMDISRAQLRQARQRVPEAGLVEADAAHPPFVHGTFDVICSLNVLHHVSDARAHLTRLIATGRTAATAPAAADTETAADAGDGDGTGATGTTIFLATFAASRNLAMRIATGWLQWRQPAWQQVLSTAALRGLISELPGVTIVAHEELRAGRFWYLQLYRLATKLEGTQHA